MTSSRPHPLTRLFYCVLGLIFASIVMGGMLYVGSAIASVWTGRDPAKQLQEIVAAYEIPLLLLSYPAQIVWISYCRTRLDGFSFGSMGLRSHKLLPNLLRGALAGGLAIGLLFAVLWLSGLVSVTGWSDALLASGSSGAALALVGYAAAFLAVGIFEEILFRGYVLQNLNHWLGWKGAVWVQAILFALVHLLNVINEPARHQAAAMGAMPALTLIAVFSALSYRKTGSLWFPIGFHFAWNFCLGPLFSFPVSGVNTFRLMEVTANESNWLSGGPFGAEGSVLLIPILLALVYFISLAPDHPQALLDLNLLRQDEIPVSHPMSTTDEPEEDNDSEHESRFRTKFGTSQGFSAETLRELRDLQEAREKEMREAEEAKKREALPTSSFAPPPATTQPVVEVAPVAITPTPEEVPAAPVPILTTPPAPAPIPIAPHQPAPGSATPAPTVPTPPTATPVKKKPSSPRW